MFLQRFEENIIILPKQSAYGSMYQQKQNHINTRDVLVKVMSQVEGNHAVRNHIFSTFCSAFQQKEKISGCR